MLIDAGEAIASSDQFWQFMADAGFGIRVRLGEEYARFVEQEHRTWQSIIEALDM